jgi:hypothetical protein
VNFPEAIQAKAIPLATLRKTLAQAGISPMGDKDEVVLRMAEHIKSLNSKAGGGDDGDGDSGGGGGGSSGGGGAMSNQTMIDSVLENKLDYTGLLSLAGNAIQKTSSTAEMRKAYLKISLKVHPDKNGQSAESKQAFQALVSAFERLSKPELFADEDDAAGGGGGGRGGKKKKKEKVVKIMRSNQGCFKTAVHCPRCNMDWGRAELGLEDGAFNFFMQVRQSN